MQYPPDRWAAIECSRFPQGLHRWFARPMRTSPAWSVPSCSALASFPLRSSLWT